jgi:Na+/H+ antiporter NhaC
MSKIFILFTFLSLYFVSNAQKHNRELLKIYSKTELSNLDIETLKILEYGITNAVYLTTIPSGKEIDLPKINIISNSLKFTDLGLKILNQNQYFIVHGTNNMLVIKSLYVLKNELENKNN